MSNSKCFEQYILLIRTMGSGKSDLINFIIGQHAHTDQCATNVQTIHLIDRLRLTNSHWGREPTYKMIVRQLFNKSICI